MTQRIPALILSTLQGHYVKAGIFQYARIYCQNQVRSQWMGDGFGYIEVNGPKQDVRPFDLEDFNDAEAGGEPELSEIVPRWAIFSETLRHSDRRAQEMQKRREPAEGSLPKGTARANVCFGKCLQLPRTVVDQLHKSHLAQQDELDGLKLLHQKRVENLQRQEYLKEKLPQAKARAEELSKLLSELVSKPREASQASQSKKLQRDAAVSQDLASKCRTAKARNRLLLRLSKQLGTDAFAAGAGRVVAVAFQMTRVAQAEVNSFTLSGIRERVQKELPGLECCVSWDDQSQLALYFCNLGAPSEDAHASESCLQSDKLDLIVEQAVQSSTSEALKLEASAKRLARLSGAEIQAPIGGLGLETLGFKSHGMSGSVLTVDWVHPEKWADAFSLRMDDVVLFVNGIPTSEMSTTDLLNINHADGLKLFVARGGFDDASRTAVL